MKSLILFIIVDASMKIEIYGVEADDYRCGGCITAKKLFEDVGLAYEFKRVLTRGADNFPEYDIELIDELVKRAKFPNRQISYPVIFIDDSIVRLKNLRDFLYDKGFDVD